MTIQIGDRLPDIKLISANADGPEAVQLGELLGGRRIVLFAVPGAFTGTCSTVHVPGFVEHLDTIKARGVDEIMVVAVNDHFVMGEWAKATKAQGKIRFLSDFDAAFAKAIGMDVDLSAGGLGVRTKRYSMIIEDGVVKQLNIEPKPGQADVSGAATILKQLEGDTSSRPDPMPA